MQVTDVIAEAGTVMEVAGVAIIVLGAAGAGAVAIARVARRATDVYTSFRREFGRVVLLGLEVLVAADIVRTVAVDPTLQSVAVLGGIVLIRTFLSFSLELEINGRWPWQKGGG